MLSHIQKVMTRANEPMLFIQLDDYSGNTEVLIFPSVYRDYASLLQEDALLVIEGKASDKDGSIKILADKVERFTPQALTVKTSLRVTRAPVTPAPAAPVPVTPAQQPGSGGPGTLLAAPPNNPLKADGGLALMLEQAFSAARLQQLKKTLESLPNGHTKIFLRIADHQGDKLIKTNYAIKKDRAALDQLAKIVGPDRICGLK